MTSLNVSMSSVRDGDGGDVVMTPYLSEGEAALVGCALGALIVFSIAGNVLVVVAIVTDRRLRTPSNYFYVSLALADTLVAALVMTLALINDLTGRWLFGPALCNIWLSADVMGSTASILHLSAISLDRYAHVRDPYRYERLVTSRVILLFIAAIWALSALMSFLPIHLGWHRVDPTDTSLSLTSTNWTLEAVGDLVSQPVSDDVCVLALNRTYAVSSSLVSFYVPCIVMTALYLRLYLLARQHLRHIRSTLVVYPHGFKRTDSSPGSVDRTPSVSNGAAVDPPSDHKAAVTLGVIMGVFLVCWTPFFTANIVVAFCESCVSNVLFHAVTWLGYVNSSLNPVIYPIFNADFRHAFHRLLAPVLCIPCKMRVSGSRGGDSGAQASPTHSHLHRRSCLPRTVGELASI